MKNHLQTAASFGGTEMQRRFLSKRYTLHLLQKIRKDCCGMYIMDENRLNKPYNSVFTHVLQYIVPHPYFQYFAR